MADSNPTTNYQQSGGFTVEDLQTAAYMFAGLAMMLNIRLSYSAAPYALLRFKLPENLFSVFVRTTSSALELWCIPSMLLGNVMEQIYNHTQNNPSSHINGITAKADDLKTNATQLKNTVTPHSTKELGSTKDTDLHASNYPQTKLGTKAEDIKTKAEALHTAAHTLERAATNNTTLADLSETAGQLKTAAGNEGTSNNLYKAAKLLAEKAGKKNTEAATGHAYNVIKAFDNLETKYEDLMNAASEEQKKSSEVIAVVSKFYEVKTTYYQMLITYRIKEKAEAFYSAANTLKTRAAALPASTNPLLKKLQQAASTQMTDLDEKAKKLKGITQGSTDDSEIVANYLEVETAYGKLMDKVKQQQAENEPLVKAVTDTFIALQKSYENVLKLRVQEIANKALELSSAAGKIADPDLTSQAIALKDAASKGPNTGLEQKATQLRDALNNGTGSADEKAGEVIDQFEAVTTEYNKLMKAATTPEQKENVKAVDDAYKALKEVYDSILNFTKIKHYSGELESAANTVNAENVITNFNSVFEAYNTLDDDKPIVHSEFDELQDEYSEAIYKYKFHFLTIRSMFTNWLNFLTFVILLIIFVTGGDNGHVTGYYVIMAISGFVFGINMVLVYAVDYRYLPFYMAGENSFPMVTSLILYFATSIFGNRRKYNSDYLVVVIDVSIAILIAFVASVLWTVAFVDYRTPMYGDQKPKWPELISPVAMVIVGMGLVYSIYPGIAPGMIVPFYLIDKIEMVLLVATAFPPVIIAILRKYAPDWSPQTNFVPSEGGFGGWKRYTGPPWEGSTTVYAWIWHFFDILIPLKIALAVIFIYSIHYRDSAISRSVVNQTKMSTFLTIVFYMCHEILLALGFPGMVGNGGAGGQVLLPVQYVGALLMVFLAFFSIGYITEYKKHDPSEWPTEGMTKWNALCYWLKMASKITNKNFKQLFTTDLLCDLVLCHKETKFIIRVKIN